MGSATGRPSFTTKRVLEISLAATRSGAIPAASMSSPMSGVVSSALLGPVSYSAPSRFTEPITPPGLAAASSTSTRKPLRTRPKAVASPEMPAPTTRTSRAAGEVSISSFPVVMGSIRPF